MQLEFVHNISSEGKLDTVARPARQYERCSKSEGCKLNATVLWAIQESASQAEANTKDSHAHAHGPWTRTARAAAGSCTLARALNMKTYAVIWPTGSTARATTGQGAKVAWPCYDQATKRRYAPTY